MKILIGGITSYKAITVAKFLKENYQGIRIFTFDSRKFTRNIRSKYSDKHFIINSNNIEKYLEIISKYDIDYFFPVINTTIRLILANKDKFGKCLDYLGDYYTFLKLSNKKQVMSLATELGIQVPKTYNNISEAKPKCVVKPTNLSSARSVYYINTEEELSDIVNKFKNEENIIAQEYIEGTGVGYSVYARDGKIITGYGHKRLAEYPIAGGSSVYRDTYNDSRMKEVASKILKAVKWTGFAMFEFKLTKDNKLYLIEINPRVWGSINQGLQNGINYFEAFLGVTQNSGNKKDIKTYLSPLIYLAFLKYIYKFNFKPLFIFFKNVNVNRSDINLFNDFGGWFSTVLRKIL